MDFRHGRSGEIEEFLKLAVAQIAEQHVRRFERRIGDLRFGVGKDHASGVEKIGQTVVVEVLDTRAPADEAGFDAESGADGHVGEEALAVVAVEDVRIVAEVRLEDIEKAIGIEVADTEAHAFLLAAVLIDSDTVLKTA